MKSLLLSPLFVLSLLSAPAMALCPGEDPEPSLSLKTEAGPTVFICGFEDREVVSPKGKRAFSDFTVYFNSAKQPAAQIIFTTDAADTYWAKMIPKKGLELEELWFFSEKPQPALSREITCSADSCQISEAKCVLKMKTNPFPKALPEFQKRSAAGTLKDDGEDLIDQIFAQAFMGDKAAKEFYAKDPVGLSPALLEAFTANRKKLEQGCNR